MNRANLIPSLPLITDGAPHLCFTFQAAKISANSYFLLRLSLWFLTLTLFSLESVPINYMGGSLPRNTNPYSTLAQQDNTCFLSVLFLCCCCVVSAALKYLPSTVAQFEGCCFCPQKSSVVGLHAH